MRFLFGGEWRVQLEKNRNRADDNLRDCFCGNIHLLRGKIGYEYFCGAALGEHCGLFAQRIAAHGIDCVAPNADSGCLAGLHRRISSGTGRAGSHAFCFGGCIHKRSVLGRFVKLHICLRPHPPITPRAKQCRAPKIADLSIMLEFPQKKIRLSCKLSLAF